MDKLLEFYRLQETDNLSMYWLKEILLALLILALFWAIARFFRYFITTWGARFTSFTKTDLDDRILARVTPSLSLLITWAGLYLAVRSLPFPEKVHLVLSGIIFIVNVGILTLVAYRTTDEMMKWYAARLAEQDRAGLDRQLLPLFEKLVTIFLVCTALIIVLKHFNYDILSLVTALGIGSLAIGMAAKDTLANMISGFTIMIDRPFRIGDRIQLSKEQWGDVLGIGLRSTKIKTADNTLLIIPNSTLCNSSVVNLAFPEVKTRGRVNVSAAYGTDVEEAKRLLVEIAASQPDVAKEPAPDAFLVSLGDSALNMSLHFSVSSYTDLLPVTDRINIAILRRFAESNIDIPFPTSRVFLQKES